MLKKISQWLKTQIKVFLEPPKVPRIKHNFQYDMKRSVSEREKNMSLGTYTELQNKLRRRFNRKAA
ncbi:hypothetical protein [Echinimonas agarilytica]|uniref:Uncharacterized protein n=1 Tax=Echinimonas agarilytica TaxID=1215918 RepID=A0AA42B7I2_9GAMM|nr:hypothetical protein [Echinimonas agarilytica]MCM2680095.1 hypothetical protein [Echinimonas agarilytica]